MCYSNSLLKNDFFGESMQLKLRSFVFGVTPPSSTRPRDARVEAVHA
jgi:hypothetical protein